MVWSSFLQKNSNLELDLTNIFMGLNRPLPNQTNCIMIILTTHYQITHN